MKNGMTWDLLPLANLTHCILVMIKAHQEVVLAVRYKATSSVQITEQHVMHVEQVAHLANEWHQIVHLTQILLVHLLPYVEITFVNMERSGMF